MKNGDAKKLLDLKQRIEEGKARLARETGKRDKIISDLKEEFKITPDEVETFLKKIGKDIDRIEAEVAKVVKELEEKYGITPNQ